MTLSSRPIFSNCRLPAFCLAAFTCFASQAGTPTIQQIPRKVGVWYYSIAAASADGRAFVGGYGNQAMRWSTWAGYEILGSIWGMSSTEAVATNVDGSVVVGWGSKHVTMNSQVYDGFVWKQATGLVRLDLVGPAPHSFGGTFIMGISDDASTLGGYVKSEYDPTDYYRQPFRRVNSTNIFPFMPASTYGRVWSLSRDGQVVVGDTGQNLSSTAARWEGDGSYQNLGYLPGDDRSSARVTNQDGSVVAGYSRFGSSGTSRPFRWTQSSGLVPYLSLLTTASVSCLSADGTFAGGSSGNTTTASATLWTSPSTPVALSQLLTSLGTDITGWTFHSVAAMSANGSILYGTGSFNGETSNWRIDLNGPCPADFNDDLQIDDTDFVAFAQAYDILLCNSPQMPTGCPSDLNKDQFVDDADFAQFAAAYSDLLCP